MKVAFAAIVALLAAQPASARVTCVSKPDAEALTLVALPDLIRETGRVCAAELPADSLIRQPSSALLSRYEAEADRAWPTARAAIVKLSDPAVDALLQSSYARPLLTALIVTPLVSRIATADCGTIGRFVTLLAPLPPRNTAGVVVETLRYLKADKSRNKGVLANLPLCPVELP